MSDPNHHLQLVAAPASGWCDPGTGVCIIDIAEQEDDTAEDTAGATDDDTARGTADEDGL